LAAELWPGRATSPAGPGLNPGACHDREPAVAAAAAERAT